MDLEGLGAIANYLAKINNQCIPKLVAILGLGGAHSMSQSYCQLALTHLLPIAKGLPLGQKELH
jgi:hypothetical protein